MTVKKDRRPGVWVGHVAMLSDRVMASRKFMIAIGMRPIFSDHGVAVLEMRGGTHLVISNNPDLGLPLSAFDLMVDDIEASHQKFTELGLNPSAIGRGSIHDEFKMTEPGGNEIRFNSSHVSGLPV